MAHRQDCRHWSGSARIPLLIALLLAATIPRAAAQELGDVAAGRLLAQTWCSSCHVIDPAPLRSVDNGAPPFVSVARMASTTPLSLHAFLQTPHAGMPDLHLSRNETDDLSGYILSLRRK
jgi:mono/diheme cytochrome c family protein